VGKGEHTRTASIYSFLASSRNFLFSFSISLVEFCQQSDGLPTSSCLPLDSTVRCLVGVVRVLPRKVFICDEAEPRVVKVSRGAVVVLVRGNPRPCRVPKGWPVIDPIVAMLCFFQRETSE